jgi:hypothetical protein
MIRSLLAILLTVCSLSISYATTYNSVQAGPWNQSSTWSPSGIPGSGDDVSIGHNVSVPTATAINNVVITSGTLSLSATLGIAGTLDLQTGASLSVGATTLTLSGQVTGGGSLTSVSSGTVSYSMGIAGQNVLAGTYGNLVFSGFSKVLASSGNIDIAGSFTPGAAASHTITGSTIRYIGGATQNVQPFTYNNLVILAPGPGVKNIVGNIKISGSFTPPTTNFYNNSCCSSTIEFNGTGTQTIPSFEYFNLKSSSTGSRILDPSGVIGVYNVFTPGTNSYTITNSTVRFFGPNGQNIPPFNYYNLIVLAPGPGAKNFVGVTKISGTFTPPTTLYYNTGCCSSIIEFNGTGTQTIPSNFEYNSLTSSSTGPRILDPSGVIGIYNVFTPGTNAYTITNSTIKFQGTGAQTIPAFNYYNLMSASTGARTLSSSGVIGVANTFTPGTNTYTVTNSTVNFNGSASQTIPSFQYHHLASSSTGARTLATTGNISIKGNFTTGTNSYTTTGSTVVFNGSTAQSITGAFNWDNLTISNTSGGVTIASGSHTLKTALTISTATSFATGSNTFTLLSDATNTARIAPATTGASVSGNFIVQRFVSSRTGNWADLSSPVANATMSDWDTQPNGSNEIYMSGVGGPDGNVTSTSGVWYSVYSYLENTDIWTPVTNASTTTLTPCQGWELWLSDNMTSLNALTFDTRGVPNIGTKTISVTNTASNTSGPGWNLVGNPYASPLSWDNLQATNTTLDPTYQIFDAGTGTYAVYGTGTDIPASQGFWIHTSSSTTMTFNEAHKGTSNSSTFHKSSYFPEAVMFKTSQLSYPYSQTSLLRPEKHATRSFEGEFDSQFMKSRIEEAPGLTFLSDDNKELVLQSFNPTSESEHLQMIMHAGVKDIYTIETSHLDNLSSYSCIFLEDKLSDKVVDLRETKSYTFESSPEIASNRFVLHLLNDNTECEAMAMRTQHGIMGSDAANIINSAEGVGVKFNLASSQPAIISVYNTLGQEIIAPVKIAAEQQTIMLHLPANAKGIYFINVNVGNQNISRKVNF